MSVYFPEPVVQPRRVTRSLTWVLCDHMGVRTHELTERSGGQVTVPLNGQRTAEVTIPYEKGANRGAAGAVTSLRSILKVWLADKLIFAGRVITPPGDGAESSRKLLATDPTFRLANQYVKIPTPYAQYGFVRVNIDQSRIMLDLIAHRRPGTSPWPDTEIHPSLGSRPATVSRTLYWEPGVNILDALHSISEMYGGVDYAFRPLDRTDGYLAQLDTFARQGSDKSGSVVFAFNTGAHNTRNLKPLPDGSLVRNLATVMGQTEEGAAPPYYTSGQLDSLALYGILEHFGGSAETAGQGTVESMARELASVLWDVPRLFELELPVEGEVGQHGNPSFGGRYGNPPAWLGTGPDAFDLGDTVQVYGYRGQMDEAHKGRVVEVTASDSEGSDAQIAVKMAPALTAAVVT